MGEWDRTEISRLREETAVAGYLANLHQLEYNERRSFLFKGPGFLAIPYLSPFNGGPLHADLLCQLRNVSFLISRFVYWNLSLYAENACV